MDCAAWTDRLADAALEGDEPLQAVAREAEQDPEFSASLGSADRGELWLYRSVLLVVRARPVDGKWLLRAHLGDDTPPLPTRPGVAFDDRGTGPALVFVHGLTYSRRAWDAVVDRLPDFRCVAPDLPGHGETGDERGFTLDDSVGALASVVDELGLAAPILVGHSAGGVIAARFASRRPVGGLVLVDQPLAVRRFADIVRPMAPALRSPAFPRIWERFERSMGYGSLALDVRSRLLAGHRVRPEVVLGSWSLLLDTEPAELEADMDARLRAIGCPVLSLHGGDMGPYSGWIRTRIPQAVVESWPGQGHFPQLADPERFASRLREAARG